MIEGQQINQSNSFFRSYGFSALIVLLIAAAAYGGYWGYKRYQANQDREASVVYAQLIQQYDKKDVKSARGNADKLIKDFGGTNYAKFAEVYMARMDFDAGDLAKAGARLEKLRGQSLPSGLPQAVNLGLARIHIAQNKAAEALNDLTKPAPGKFAAEYDEVRGDAYVALNKPADAREAYKKALAQLDKNDPYRSIVQLKLDQIGG